MGHSKGGDLASASAVFLNDIFGLAIVNSCLPNAPVLIDTSYGDQARVFQLHGSFALLT